MAIRSGLKKTNRRGVYYREHPTRKYGVKKDRQYIIRYWIAKKEVTEVYGWESEGKTELDAERKLAELKTNAKNGTGPVTLAEESRLKEEAKQREEEARKAAEEAERNRCDMSKLFEKYQESKGEYKTARTDKSNFNKHIAPTLGNKYPEQLTPFDIDRIRISMQKTYKPQTVKHVLRLLSRLCLFGSEKHYCEPLRFKVKVPEVHNEKTEDLTEEQMVKYLNAIEADSNFQVRCIMKLALFTGMRRSEILRLKWDDVNSEKKYIRIRAPKGGKDQVIPLNKMAEGVLDEVRKSIFTSDEFVFPGRKGKPRGDTGKAARRIRDAAGLPADFRPMHGLRHTFASAIASSGEVDMYVLQKLLTHKSPEMTQRYAHLRDEALQRASGIASRLFGEQPAEETTTGGDTAAKAEGE